MPHCPPSSLTRLATTTAPQSKPRRTNTAPLQEPKKLAKNKAALQRHHQGQHKPPLSSTTARTLQSNSGTDRRIRVSTMMGSLLLLFFLLISGVRFGGGARLGGNGGGVYEDWRLGTATYVKESQGHPLNDGGGACGYGDLDIFRYGRYTAGLSGAMFDRGSACGGCYELRCVNNILWCLRGSPTVVVTATDFCPPNFGLADDFGGWCNFPKVHLEMTEAAFLRVAKAKADIVQVQFRRVSCDRAGGIRFTITGGANFLQVLITNVAGDGEVDAVKVKGSKTGWIPMGRNWGQNWQCDADLRGQPLSFEVTGGKGRTITMYNVAPSDWMFAQTFSGKQFVQ